jgi:hypothetical protein
MVGRYPGFGFHQSILSTSKLEEYDESSEKFPFLDLHTGSDRIRLR